MSEKKNNIQFPLSKNITSIRIKLSRSRPWEIWKRISVDPPPQHFSKRVYTQKHFFYISFISPITFDCYDELWTYDHQLIHESISTQSSCWWILFSLQREWNKKTFSIYFNYFDKRMFCYTINIQIPHLKIVLSYVIFNTHFCMFLHKTNLWIPNCHSTVFWFDDFGRHRFLSFLLY